jgi:hypothetical protein
LPLKKAYLETSIINRAHDRKLSGLSLKDVLEKHELVPAIGLHTIYEMDRTFLREGGEQRGAALFQIFFDIRPILPACPGNAPRPRNN